MKTEVEKFEEEHAEWVKRMQEHYAPIIEKMLREQLDLPKDLEFEMVSVER